LIPRGFCGFKGPFFSELATPEAIHDGLVPAFFLRTSSPVREYKLPLPFPLSLSYRAANWRSRIRLHPPRSTFLFSRSINPHALSSPLFPCASGACRCAVFPHSQLVPTVATGVTILLPSTQRRILLFAVKAGSSGVHFFPSIFIFFSFRGCARLCSPPSILLCSTSSPSPYIYFYLPLWCCFARSRRSRSFDNFYLFLQSGRESRALEVFTLFSSHVSVSSAEPPAKNFNFP